MPQWNPDLYLQFANERTQPSIDLATRVRLRSPRRILDAGCGPGNSTAILRKRWPEAEIIGLDSSPEMIEAARSAYPEGHWICSDLAGWQAETPFDLIFSNAVLHWLPDHQKLLPHLFHQLTAGGALAVQMPAHYKSVLHQLIMELSEAGEWQSALETARHSMHVESPTFYYELLSPLASHIDIYETTYFHVMDNALAILNWIRGTGLRPFLDALPNAGTRLAFKQKLLVEIERAYPPSTDGKVLFPFPRLFFIAYR